jgi:serine/threonine protein kinase
MEYSGDTLEKLLKNNNININEKVLIGKQIIKGLEYLHRQGIIHRDIKSSNILVSKEFGKYHARIIDFNFSKFIFSNEKLNETIGTLAYCAPELLKDSLYDKSVDLWSLGVVLFEIFHGYHPFDQDNNSELTQMVNKICYDNSQIYILENSTEIDNSWKEIIKICLSKKPEHRLNIRIILDIITKS